MSKKVVFAVISAIVIIGLACGKKSEKNKNVSFPTLSEQEIADIQAKMAKLPAEHVSKNDVAVIETNFGTIEFEFFPDVAPIHCSNFKKLANNGFYNGVTFHRVIPGFVIQGGDILTRDNDPSNDGTGSPGYTIDAEFSDISHKRGIVSMARKGNDINSAGSQFYICLADLPNLDGQYSVFGRVIKGMDVVDKIAAVPTDDRDRPLDDVVMTKVTVEKRNQ